ncbi:Similar to Serine/threonine-protein kinase plo1; acc. no. P50528 [Pyronema omphalodes CBS 100304]|uniref:Serine/threonine-protein kinase n=1 Tax=Pyronema omphalodes (strain CBS 100304) TaxID=1076935 RepID=U4LIN2_PYROM|nr:Similar to Serine/threonine-protein kinase plo1; acc. no. P50528 [Pyronema omphalodes CBS 100304]
MASHRPRTTSALNPAEPNIQLQPRRQKYAPQNPSPLKKQSDYELGSTAARAVKPSAAAAPPKTPKVVKARKKTHCATPPSVLQDLKGRRQYDRGLQIGEGGFARVFLGQNKDGSQFAVKAVAKSSLQSERMRGKFLGEIQVHKTMQHPNIVRFIEVFEDDENIYMILELCHNKSLMDMLRRRKRFTEPETRFFMLQLLGALKYMHGKRVIHRDLKLGNIFLDETMNVKIGDFGLAALLVDEDERKMTICGTPNYIAPEVLFGKDGEGHSFEVDIWGIGVIMYAMLVGKPPFQSTDIDSIYKKIKQNAFEWPETISISSEAKGLVTSLLNRDPNARPSIDEIANHAFFQSGYFPLSIPTYAVQKEPQWPGQGSSYASVQPNRQEWRRNYESVAKNAGVGFDSPAVGEKANQPLQPIIPPMRPSSAASRAGAANADPSDPAKILERKRREAAAAAAAAEKEKAGNYILPEALSPRDGHARMRNIGALKSVPSRLAPLRIAALTKNMPLAAAEEEEQDDEEEVSDEEEDEEEEEDDKDADSDCEMTDVGAAAMPPPPPPQPQRRAIDKPPMRTVSTEAKSVTNQLAAAAISTQPEGAGRRLTRASAQSHAATQREGPVRSSTLGPARREREVEQVQAVAPIQQPAQRAIRPQRVERGERVERVERVEREDRAAPAEGQERVERARPQPPRRVAAPEPSRPPSVASTRPPSAASTIPSAPSSSSTTRHSPDAIPPGSTLSSRVGKAIPSTSTSSIISSLIPIITSLTAFSNGTLRSLGPSPAATIQAISAFKRGEGNKAVFVKKWVDYTNKYGMAYMLSDGTVACFYNDNTSLVVDGVGGEGVEWVTHSLVEGSSGSGSSGSAAAGAAQAAETAARIKAGKETVFRRLSTEMTVIRQRAKTSRGLMSKLMIWRRTVNYMINTLGNSEHWGCTREEAIREPTIEGSAESLGQQHLMWVTTYARLKRCVVFRLVDGTIQLNFVDHTKLILTSSGRTLRLITKDNILHVYSLEEAYEKCRKEESFFVDFGLKHKIVYVKEILRGWVKSGRFPVGGDSKDGQQGDRAQGNGGVLILGEGPE